MQSNASRPNFCSTAMYVDRFCSLILRCQLQLQSSIPRMVSGKAIRDEFFRRVPNKDGIWRCICKTERKQSGSSYANLVSHVRYEHSEAYEAFVTDNQESIASSSVDAENSSATSFFFKKKTR